MEELRFVTLDEVPRYEAPSSFLLPVLFNCITLSVRIRAHCPGIGIFLPTPFPPDFEGKSSGGFLPPAYDSRAATVTTIRVLHGFF